MSYERVKAIKIENGEVFINSHSNNDTADYHFWKAETLTKILKEQGEDALNVEILKEYIDGNFQSSSNNKYTRALKVLYYLLKDDFKKFEYNWNDNEQTKRARELRESEEYKALLLKALNTKLPKEKFIIVKKGLNDYNSFVFKTTSRHIFYTNDITKAKVYDFKEQAEEVLRLSNDLKQNGEVRIKVK